MQTTEPNRAERHWSNGSKVDAWFICVLGAAGYAVLSAGIFLPPGVRDFGGMIYNYYYLSLLQGHLTVPARVIGFEGWYDAAGNAYSYYGMAPLVTRALLAPFVDLRTTSLSAFTIWLFASLGVAFYQFTFKAVMEHFGQNMVGARLTCALIGAAVWIASPGPILVSNASVYHEPIAVGFCACAAAIALMTKVAFLGRKPADVMLPFAIATGLCIHSRPHIAIGLAAGFSLLMLMHLRAQRLRDWPRLAVASTLVLLFGLEYIFIQSITMGSMLHFAGIGPALKNEYGFTYWGLESAHSPRMQAFVDHGTFNIRRIVPNLFSYMFDAPISSWMKQVYLRYRQMTASLGLIRVEEPRVGTFFLWLPWLGVILAQPPWKRLVKLPHLAMFLSMLLGTLLTLAYGTVTMRYAVELWPPLAVLAVFACSLCSSRPSAVTPPAFTPVRSKFVFPAARAMLLLLSLPATATLIRIYPGQFPERWLFQTWTFEECRDVASLRQFGPSDIERICKL